MRMLSRSSWIHVRSRGHSRNSASWATSTPSGQRDHPGDVAAALRVELGQRDPSPLDRATGPLGGEAYQRAPGHGPLRRVQLPVRLLGEPRDGAADAAGALVRGMAQAPAVPAPPELQQRGGQQRQRAGLALDVRHQGVGECRLDPQPDTERRPLDGVAQLVAPHRRDEHVVGRQQV
jgi:hypothetical protein